MLASKRLQTGLKLFEDGARWAKTSIVSLDGVSSDARQDRNACGCAIGALVAVNNGFKDFETMFSYYQDQDRFPDNASAIIADRDVDAKTGGTLAQIEKLETVPEACDAISHLHTGLVQQLTERANDYSVGHCHDSHKNYSARVDKIEDSITTEFGGKVCQAYVSGLSELIWAYNDLPITTWKDIKASFETAIDLALEQEAEAQ